MTCPRQGLGMFVRLGPPNAWRSLQIRSFSNVIWKSATRFPDRRFRLSRDVLRQMHDSTLMLLPKQVSYPLQAKMIQ